METAAEKTITENRPITDAIFQLYGYNIILMTVDTEPRKEYMDK